MYCTNCGNQLPDGTDVCQNCGTVNKITEAKPEQTHAEQQTQTPAPETPPIKTYSLF